MSEVMSKSQVSVKSKKYENTSSLHNFTALFLLSATLCLVVI